MACNNFKDNMAMCNCTYKHCPRKGTCCQCLAYHRRNAELPACYFTAEQERTYNRSLSYFFECSG